jgi:hypothetical protein
VGKAEQVRMQGAAKPGAILLLLIDEGIIAG